MNFVPYRVEPSTPYPDNLNVINQNFNQVLESLEDTGPLTGVSSSPLDGILVFADSLRIEVFYADEGSGFNRESVLFDPKFHIRIDVNDADHQFPDGKALTEDQLKFVFSVINSISTRSGSLGETVLQIRNADPTNDHTLFITGQVKVYSKPQDSVYR